jgi:hypothetical protein
MVMLAAMQQKPERCEESIVSTSDLWACNILLLDTNTFSPTQDPAVEPTCVTEGIIPVRMNRGDFFVTGETSSKFHSTFPSVTFREFWDIKLRLYEKRKSTVKEFITEFQRDPVRHAKILSDRSLH